jgi:hypothetical protein
MEKNATVISKYYDDFTPLFWESVNIYLEDKNNGYQKFYLPTKIDEGTFQWFINICDELRSKGFTEKDLLFFDNTW